MLASWCVRQAGGVSALFILGMVGVGWLVSSEHSVDGDVRSAGLLISYHGCHLPPMLLGNDLITGQPCMHPRSLTCHVNTRGTEVTLDE